MKSSKSQLQRRDEPNESNEPKATSASSNWMEDLKRTYQGRVLSILENCVTILSNDDDYRGRIWRNDMDASVMVNDSPLQDLGVVAAREWLSKKHEVNIALAEVYQAFTLVASRNARHPVRDWLEKLRWDGTARIDTLCERAIGNKGSLQALMLRKWLLSAVARAFEAGVKADAMLVLQSRAQGLGKSAFFASLGGQWFTDSVNTGKQLDKDALFVAHRHWICELAELDGITRKSGGENLKALLTRRIDEIRRPYARTSETLPRGFVFAGTLNEDGFLQDPTGSRRFWVITTDRKIDIDLVRRERDQIWAEAVQAYKNGEEWWFDRITANKIEVAQREFLDVDPRFEMVREWARGLRKPFTIQDVAVKCLGYEPSRVDKSAQTSIGMLLAAMHAQRRDVYRCGDRFREYSFPDVPTTPDDRADPTEGWNAESLGSSAESPTSPCLTG